MIEGNYSWRFFSVRISLPRTPIKCDSTIRLLHVTTKRNLHSHEFVSPLSHNQEVSASGEDGEGDLWKVVCTSRNDYWLRKDGIRLQHVVSGKYETEVFFSLMNYLSFRYLHLTGDTYGRPIHGQKEISCYSYANNQNIWKVDAGVYIRRSSELLSSPPNDSSHTRTNDHFDDEL